VEIRLSPPALYSDFRVLCNLVSCSGTVKKTKQATCDFD
jgi:hypothetical protein